MQRVFEERPSPAEEVLAILCGMPVHELPEVLFQIVAKPFGRAMADALSEGRR
jgi:hypothetical protein